MLISELIKRLDKIRQSEGDLPVRIGVCRQGEEDLTAELPSPVISRLLDEEVITSFSDKWSADLPKVVWL